MSDEGGLSYEDLRRILALVHESDYGELRLEAGGVRLYIRKAGEPATLRPDEPTSGDPGAEAASPELAPARAAKGEAAGAQPDDGVIPAREGLWAVRAPMVGTFYRAPAPDAPPFVEVGDEVSEGDEVCLVEVMKLFNAVAAGATGTVREILVENGSMVEYGQEMILIEPHPE